MRKKYRSPVLLLCGAAVIFVLAFFLGRLSRGDEVTIETQRRVSQTQTQQDAALHAYVEDKVQTAAQSGQAEGTLDLNSATYEQLRQLPGVGEKTAQAIVDYRARYGRFVSVEQLLDVTGIGEGLLAQVRELLYVEQAGGVE